MREELKNIKSGFGLGLIKFGMTRDEVKSILGEPNEVDAFSYSETEEDLTESWNYEDLSLSVNFDEDDDWKLVMISVYAEFYQFNDKALIGADRESLLKYLKEMKIDDLNFVDCSSEESPDQHLIEIDSMSMNFWINDGILDEIQWSPHFIDDDTIKWPN